jgi:hypothetical protein
VVKNSHTTYLNFSWQLLGSPEDDDLGFLRSENARRYLRQLPRYARVPLAQRYRDLQPAAIDLIDKMLVFDPDKRITGTIVVNSCGPLPGLIILVIQ